MPSFDQVIVWMVVGLIGGSLAGLLVTREKRGLGWSRNLGLGLAGALGSGRNIRRRDRPYADLISLRWAMMPLRDRMAPSM